MIWPFILLSLAHFAQGTLNNSTSSSCPTPDGDTRSVWIILETCALTLLICTWHAIHLDIPGSGDQEKLFYERVPWIFFTSFFGPEAIVATASKRWCEAHAKVREFHVQGYEWSMTHSFFAEMGGFTYDEGDGSPRTITSYEFLILCERGEIVNPLLTEKEIKALSKSDALGKTIFTIQLFWFMLQVVARGSMNLAITLVELDTLCMAVLALVYIYFWWAKPYQPQRPHVFYRTQEAKIYSKAKLSKAWKPESSFLYELITDLVCICQRRSIQEEEKPSSAEDSKPEPGKLMAFVEQMNPVDIQLYSLYMSWTI